MANSLEWCWKCAECEVAVGPGSHFDVLDFGVKHRIDTGHEGSIVKCENCDRIQSLDHA